MTGGSTNGVKSGVSKARAFAIGAPMIIALVAGLFAAAYLLSALLRLPVSFSFPVAGRALGGAVVVGGLAVAGWTFSTRNPADVMLSTYVSLTKALGRASLAEKGGRTEPLIVAGPQRYTRNPLYFGVVLMVFGWAIFATSPFLLVATAVLLAWFGLVLIPYEERELNALFGEQWVRYSESTPMLVPFTKRRREQTE